jgi:hypothetical protein
MKHQLLIAAVATAFTLGAPEASAAVTSAEVVSKVEKSIKAEPKNLLTVVTENVTATPEFACEIVASAIKAVKADAALVGQIVEAAVTAAPNYAATITECAIKAAPEAKEEIKAAVNRAFSGGDGKNPVSSGKAPVGKGPVGKSAPQAPADDSVDFGSSPVAIGGVYLVYPSGGGGSLSIDGKSGRITTDKNGRRVLVGPDGKVILVLDDTTSGGGGGNPRNPGGGGGGVPTRPTGAQG